MKYETKLIKNFGKLEFFFSFKMENKTMNNESKTKLEKTVKTMNWYDIPIILEFSKKMAENTLTIWENKLWLFQIYRL